MLAHTQVRDPRESAAACCRHALGTPPPGHRLTIDSIQIFEIASFQKPFYLVVLGLEWFSTDASQA